MNDSGTVLGWISFALLGVWRIYWFVSEKQTEKEKPKKTSKTAFLSRGNISKTVTLLAFGIVGVQLLGIELFPLPVRYPLIQYGGFLLVVIGLGTAIAGRRELGTNWANCYEYQVKQKQSLVMTGIYSYIRHPVYTGIALFFIGSELIVQSYLLFFYLLLTFPAVNTQAKWEESLLTKHFGEEYREYMKRTKRLLPFIW